jgi:alkaline phosphatase D
MAISRRDFLLTTAATAALPLGLRAQTAAGERDRLFRHGVASGDPLVDRVMLWTRVTPPPTRRANGPIDVRWRIGADEQLTRIVASGAAQATPARDFTVKVDAGTLQPGRTYYYAFDAAGEESPIGRTKTLPAAGGARLRLASVSCSNYPAGYFNVYRCLANREELDVVVHLGDYIYEFANGAYGDGSGSGRVPMPAGEAVTLADYRGRYATYRSDVDLQDAHRRHPFVVVWDDHEIANDASVAGAPGHTAKHGSWATRRAEAYQAYLEWMPIRESSQPGIRLYRDFRFSDLADLVMLDTRGWRDRQVPGTDFDALADPRRSLLGTEQEAWLHARLRASQSAGTRWRVLGQQVLFAPLAIPGVAVQNTDVWDGYPAARRRVFEMIASEKLTDIAILTGDIHSSWAMDVPRPDGRYDARTGAGSVAIELVTPAISSPPMFANPQLRERATLLKLAVPHLKYLEGEHRGYVLIDITRDRLQADWYHVANVSERSPSESKATSFVCERGSSRLSLA